MICYLMFGSLFNRGWSDAYHQKHLAKQNPVTISTESQAARIAELEREIRELKQANEIIRKAAAFFAQAELGRPHK